MDVNMPIMPAASLALDIGPHRQQRDRNVSERHHPYTRPAPTSSMIEKQLSVINIEPIACKSFFKHFVYC